MIACDIFVSCARRGEEGPASALESLNQARFHPPPTPLHPPLLILKIQAEKMHCQAFFICEKCIQSLRKIVKCTQDFLGFLFANLGRFFLAWILEKSFYAHITLADDVKIIISLEKKRKKHILFDFPIYKTTPFPCK